MIDAIAHKRHRGQKALTRAQKSWNRDVSRLRARVEHPFAWMKQMAQGFRGRCRYRGRRRNELDFALNLAAYNWKRSLSLATA